MVTATFPSNVLSELDFRVEIVKDGSISLPGGGTRERSSQEFSFAKTKLVTADEVILELFHMTLASLRGYQELSRLVNEEPLKTFLDVIIRQRTARCQALAQLSPETMGVPLDFNPDDESLANAGAFELRIIWLRAIWSFEKCEFSRFGDHIEMAESMLEDTYLTAAHTFRLSAISALFRGLALDVCGARQRLESLSADLAIAAKTDNGHHSYQLS
jgi:hypothetical protein